MGRMEDLGRCESGGMEGRMEGRHELMGAQLLNLRIRPFLPAILPSRCSSFLPSIRPPPPIPTSFQISEFSKISNAVTVGWRDGWRKEGMPDRMNDGRNVGVGELKFRISEILNSSFVPSAHSSVLSSFVRSSFPPFLIYGFR